MGKLALAQILEGTLGGSYAGTIKASKGDTSQKV